MLSIFIPTYKRKKELFITISYLINAIKFLRSKKIKKNIEIVISKNYFKDDIEDSINLLKKNNQLFEFKVIERTLNIGGSENVATYQENTNGDNIWILCDDDIPHINSVFDIVKTIEKFPNSLIYLNRNISKDVSNLIPQNENFLKKQPQLLIHESNEDKFKFIIEKESDLCTASSLIYCKNKKEKWWYLKFGTNNEISPYCIALDHISSFPIIEIKSKVQYTYINANKDAWGYKWGNVLVFEIEPAKKVFLKWLQIGGIPKESYGYKLRKSSEFKNFLGCLQPQRIKIMPKSYLILFIKFLYYTFKIF